MVLSLSLSSIFDLTNHVPWIWPDLKDNTQTVPPPSILPLIFSLGLVLNKPWSPEISQSSVWWQPKKHLLIYCILPVSALNQPFSLPKWHLKPLISEPCITMATSGHYLMLCVTPVNCNGCSHSLLQICQKLMRNDNKRLVWYSLMNQHKNKSFWDSSETHKKIASL